VRLLSVNAGSTSTKLTLLDESSDLRRYESLDEAVHEVASTGGVDAVVHRVVHGGARTGPVVVDGTVRAELEALTELAPLHQPPSLQAIDTCRRLLPTVPQVACFDTAFHATLPVAARTYALPERLRQQVRVYGFHGLSHAWSGGRARVLAPGARRVVVAHLGGGASLCGQLDGRSVSTTMGFTPLDGLVMATRSGTVDPGALLWLARHTEEDLDQVLEHESGLLGLCGTGDMREVLRRCDPDSPDGPDDSARLAVEVYVHRLVQLLGGCAAALQGLDVLVFTGGVGENGPLIRSLVCERLAWLGLRIDDAASRTGTCPATSTETELTAPGSAVRTFVVPAREDRQMFLEAASLLASSG